jgi:hypothetical protein
MNPETVKKILGMLLEDMQHLLQTHDESNKLSSANLLWAQAMLREYVIVWKLGHGYIDPPVESSMNIYDSIAAYEKELKKLV